MKLTRIEMVNLVRVLYPHFNVHDAECTARMCGEEIGSEEDHIKHLADMGMRFQSEEE